MRGPARLDRRFLYWTARSLFRSRTSSPLGEGDQPDRLLLVRIDERVGNLITIQSLIDALRGRWPKLEIGLLASTRSDRVIDGLENLDRVHLVDKRWFFRRHRKWRAALKGVRGCGYQIAIDASAWHEFSFTHAALSYYSGAPVRLGYARGVDARFHTEQVDPGPAEEHELRQRMRLLEPLGISGEPPVPRTRLGLDSAATWADWLERHQVGKPRIGLWAGSRKTERRWPVPFYVQLGRQLQRSHEANLVVLWGPGEEGIRDHLAAAIPEGLVAAPGTDLDELAGLIRNLDMVVTNDTGPMHLAVACGIKTVALFASGDRKRWGHPYPHVTNLSMPGRNPAEVKRAHRACSELLKTGPG